MMREAETETLAASLGIPRIAVSHQTFGSKHQGSVLFYRTQREHVPAST